MPTTAHHLQKRKKVNFMIDESLFIEFTHWVPAGERSDFMNFALQDAVSQAKREKAMQMMDKVREEGRWKLTPAKIRQIRDYGRA